MESAKLVNALKLTKLLIKLNPAFWDTLMVGPVGAVNFM
jgi:hypothetical protein